MRKKSSPWQGFFDESKSLETLLCQSPGKKTMEKTMEYLSYFYDFPYTLTVLDKVSEENRPNLSLDLEDVWSRFQKWWINSHNSSTLLLSLSRWSLRQHYKKIKTEEHLNNQISPILSISSELLGLVDEYADSLDRHTHLCFVLHAEGLSIQEISAFTNFEEKHVELYIKSAKKLIKEKLKSLLEAS